MHRATHSSRERRSQDVVLVRSDVKGGRDVPCLSGVEQELEKSAITTTPQKHSVDIAPPHDAMPRRREVGVRQHARRAEHVTQFFILLNVKVNDICQAQSREGAFLSAGLAPN
ncbi:hypothetical protein FGB62_28g17 [Gracilaria domingensis]|nr:hypothetical protein FGB62_28g17 [Gracilaria domingensis]